MEKKNKRKDYVKKRKKDVLKDGLAEYVKHRTKRKALVKFLLVLLVFITYLAFSVGRYGGRNGLLVTVFTWSLFVLCTPIADAGFLIDFPIRLFTKIRMVYSESILWVLAILLNTFGLFFFQEIYNKTMLLRILRLILANPFPNWIIIILSAAGTFLSIYFGDELIDVYLHEECKKYHKHRNKYLMTVIVFIIVLIILSYYHIIHKLGISF